MRKFPHHWLQAWLFLFSICMSPLLSAQNSTVTAEVSYNDNVDFTPTVDQPVSATLVSIRGNHGIVKQLNPSSRISLVGSVSLNGYTDYPLDHFIIGMSAAYSRKLGLGFTAPRLRVDVESELRNFEVNIRDAVVGRFRVGVRKPVNDRFDVAFSITAEKHWVKNDQPTPLRLATSVSGNAFDQDFIIAQISSTTQLNQNWSLPVRLSFIDGDIISVSQPNPVILARSLAANDYSEVREGSIAYRSGGQAESLAIGFDRIISHNASVRFSYTHQSGEAGAETKYSRNLFALQYALSW